MTDTDLREAIANLRGPLANPAPHSGGVLLSGSNAEDLRHILDAVEQWEKCYRTVVMTDARVAERDGAFQLLMVLLKDKEKLE